MNGTEMTLVRTGEVAFPCFEFHDLGIIVRFTNDEGTKYVYLISKYTDIGTHSIDYKKIKEYIFLSHPMRIVFYLDASMDFEIIPYLFIFADDHNNGIEKIHELVTNIK